jgi:hypothetical protein
MYQVTRGLYIGSAWAEMNEPALTKAGITDILQVSRTAPTVLGVALLSNNLHMHVRGWLGLPTTHDSCIPCTR